MATYISLVQFTDKGIQAAKQTSRASGGLERQGPVEGREHQADVLDIGTL